MYYLSGNKQRKKGAANGSSLMMFRKMSGGFIKQKSRELEHTWKNKLLVVVGYNSEVFTIFWRAHCKDLFN